MQKRHHGFVWDNCLLWQKKTRQKKRLTMLKCDLKRVVCDMDLRKQWTQMFQFAHLKYSRGFFERTGVTTTAHIPCWDPPPPPISPSSQ